MRTTTFVLALLVLLLSTGCGNKIDDKLGELAAKPAATDIKSAKALYDEVSGLIRWVENPKTSEKMSPAQLERAKALQKQRRDQLVAFGGEKILSSVSEALDKLGVDVKNIDVGKKVGEARDWVLGINDPRFKKFACREENGNEVDVTKEGASKLCR